MKIDASTTKTTKHGRPFTLSAAVANALDGIEVGGIVTVSELVDRFGRKAPRAQFDMLVNKHKGQRRFTIRKCLNGGVAQIIRLE